MDTGTLEEAIAAQAREFIGAFRGEDSPVDADVLDYSEASLVWVDKILNDFFEQKAELPVDLYCLASAYVFECARKQYGGRYLLGDDDANLFVLVIGEPDCQINFCAMEKVMLRATNGPEDDLCFFYQGLAEPFAAKRSVTVI